MLQVSSCNRVAHKPDSIRYHQANQLDLVELGLNHLGQLRRISIPACQFNYLQKESWYTTRMRIEVYVPRKEIYKRFDTKKE
jgi:predicted MPP superfamily phosphohydrolase